jgi:hypothetical protein
VLVVCSIAFFFWIGIGPLNIHSVCIMFIRRVLSISSETFGAQFVAQVQGGVLVVCWMCPDVNAHREVVQPPPLRPARSTLVDIVLGNM